MCTCLYLTCSTTQNSVFNIHVPQQHNGYTCGRASPSEQVRTSKIADQNPYFYSLPISKRALAVAGKWFLALGINYFNIRRKFVIMLRKTPPREIVPNARMRCGNHRNRSQVYLMPFEIHWLRFNTNGLWREWEYASLWACSDRNLLLGRECKRQNFTAYFPELLGNSDVAIFFTANSNFPRATTVQQESRNYNKI